MGYEEYLKEFIKSFNKTKRMALNLKLYRETGDPDFLTKDTDVYYTVHEFADIVGVCEKTVRRWDESGKIKCHHRTSSGYRVYSEDEVKKVLENKKSSS